MAAAYALVGIVGGAIAFALVWPHGFLLALASAPIGGSLLVMLVVVWQIWNSNWDDEDQTPADVQGEHSVDRPCETPQKGSASEGADMNR
jgi:hypothetical protein